MNRDRVRGRWKQIKGGFMEQWGNWIGDAQVASAARREIWAGRLQEAFGTGKEAATAGDAASTQREFIQELDHANN